MNYIIVDLEATCWERREGRKNEIIEIGAVCINDKLDILDEFNKFIVPTVNPTLSDFCIGLTSITQENIDSANEFPVVILSFIEWINSFEGDYILCSWGHYDRVQFKNDCELHELDWSWTNRHISLKHQYGKMKGQQRAPGMKRALKSEKIPLDGTHHRGIDDAKNILKIFTKYYERWDFEALFSS